MTTPRIEINDLDRLLDVLEGVERATLRYEIRRLRAIRTWALDQLGIDYAVGDAVRIRSDFRIDLTRAPGWAGYEEALAADAQATVTEIDFNVVRGFWYVQVVLDREWVVGTGLAPNLLRWWHGLVDETPEGFEPPSSYGREHYPRGRKHQFLLRTTDVRKV